MCATTSGLTKPTTNMGGIRNDLIPMESNRTPELQITLRNRQIRPEQVKSYANYCVSSPTSTASKFMHFGEYNSSAEDDPLYLYPYSAEQDDTPSDDEYNPNEGDESNDVVCCRKGYTRRRSARGKPTPADPGWTAKHHRRHFVHHNYHDHSEDMEEYPIFTAGNVNALSAKGGVVTPFPLVLYNMLDSAEDQGFSGIVSWLPHGRAFSVYDSKSFVEQVMPKFFRQSKISSFQRQLNLYGFCRLTGQSSDRGGYYNEFFLRGRPDLTAKMHRTRVKGTGVRTSSNPHDEPNFYEMTFMGSGDCFQNTPIPLPTVRSSEMNHLHELDVVTSSIPCDIVAYNQGELDASAASLDTLQYQKAEDPIAMDIGDVDTTELALFLKDVDLASEDLQKGDPAMLTGVDIHHVDSIPV